MSGTRTCTACGEKKAETEEFFSLHPRVRADGSRFFRAVCRPCRSGEEKQRYRLKHDEIRAKQSAAYDPEANSRRGRAYRAKNLERLHAYDRERLARPRKPLTAEQLQQRSEYRKQYKAGHREQLREKASRYFSANRERCLIVMAQYRAAHPEQRLEWQRNNKDKLREYANARRARKLESGGVHTAQDIQEQYERQQGKCFYCHKKVGKKYHVDHVMPLSKGGSNGPENLVIACPSCNLHKQALHPMEFCGRML